MNYYRCWLPLDAIKRFAGSGFEVRIYTQEQVGNFIQVFGGKYTDNLLMDKKVHVVSRLYHKQGLNKFLDAVHSENGLVVFDTDDDLTDEFRELGDGPEFIRTMREMDLVTTSTPHLARRMAEYIGYVPPVLENHVDFGWFSRVSARCERRVPGLSVGLIGTASHYEDWKYPADALGKLTKKHHEITIAVAGYMPDYLGKLGAFSLQGVPYHLYPTLMRQFDIVCCSLDPDDEFNKSKSAIKHLEASAAERVLPNGRIGGAVAVCTNMPVYRRTVNGKNGLLVSNDQWFDALDELVMDQKKRLRIAEAGYKWTKKHRAIERGYVKWSRLYRDLATKGLDHVRNNKAIA